MAVTESASRFDKHYFRTYRQGPYERNDAWLAAFGNLAEGIVREFRPGTVLDAGCAFGLLVEALRDRDVEAYGYDVSEFAIRQVRDDVKPFCRVGSVLDEITGRYDLVTCLDVLEHVAPEDAERAVARLCAATDDVFFSSAAPADLVDDTHLNVRPIEYWSGFFAQQGFFRDVELDPGATGRLDAVRFRRRSEPVHRIVVGYERRLRELAQENVALRRRALETKALLARHEHELQRAATAALDVTALQRTVAEQAEHLDALDERLAFMADREGELREALAAAREQLADREEAVVPLRAELAERARVIDEMGRALEERTAWAERMVSETEQRGTVIEGLERVVAERTAWAERMVAEAEHSGSIVGILHRLLEEQTARADRATAEVEVRDRMIEALRAQEPAEERRRSTSEAEA